jgi:predicted transcriptional regulator
MSTVELKNRLIDKIQKTDNENLLGEAFRLLELESEDIEIYKLNDGQKKAIEEARKQIKNGQFLTDEQASKEISEWLNKE